MIVDASSPSPLHIQRPVLTVAGIYGSGPRHWQTLWEQKHANVRRVQQRDWDYPVMQEWVAAIDEAVAGSVQPPLLVAHSLGCLAAAHWCAQSARAVHAVLMVALPDPAGPNFPPDARGFEPAPSSLRDRACRVLASTDDPYSNLPFVTLHARMWRADLQVLGAFGHLNDQTGLGDWDNGWQHALELAAPA